MIGQTICSQARMTGGTACLLVAGMSLLGLSLYGSDVHFAIVSVLPLTLAGVLWYCRNNSFSAEISEATIVSTSPWHEIPYASMEGLWIGGITRQMYEVKAKRDPITLMHEDGVLHIPAHLNVPSVELYRFLLSKFTRGGSREVNPLLEDYLRRQRELFGEDRVWSFCGRKHLGHAFNLRGRLLPGLLACLLAGIFWMVIGYADETYDDWFGAGLFLCILSTVLILCGRLAGTSRRRRKLSREASLIISPTGLAMVQGDVKGEMRWDELREVRLVTKPHGPDGRGIMLRVEGSSFFILDIFDRPLPLIFKHIEAYWRQPAAAQA